MSKIFLETDDLERKKRTYDGKLLVTVKGQDSEYRSIISYDDPEDVLGDMYRHGLYGGIKNLENIGVERIKVRDDGSFETQQIDWKEIGLEVYPTNLEEGKIHIDLEHPITLV